MKFLRNILVILLNLISIPLSVLTAAGLIWYSLPMFSTTGLGIFISNHFSSVAIFWITLGCAIGFLVTYVLQVILSKHISAKFKNFFVHLNTWLVAALGVGLSVYTFGSCNPLISNELIITNVRKVGIAVILVSLILFHVLSGKISKLINRRIQAYETAKESNIVGRGNVILINILKFIEIIFPEILILLLLCFCVSWNVASYFIVMVVSALIPLIGNIVSDFNTRIEIRYINKKKDDELAKKIADNMRGE